MSKKAGNKHRKNYPLWRAVRASGTETIQGDLDVRRDGTIVITHDEGIEAVIQSGSGAYIRRTFDFKFEPLTPEQGIELAGELAAADAREGLKLPARERL